MCVFPNKLPRIVAQMFMNLYSVLCSLRGKKQNEYVISTQSKCIPHRRFSPPSLRCYHPTHSRRFPLCMNFHCTNSLFSLIAFTVVRSYESPRWLMHCCFQIASESNKEGKSDDEFLLDIYDAFGVSVRSRSLRHGSGSIQSHRSKHVCLCILS